MHDAGRAVSWDLHQAALLFRSGDQSAAERHCRRILAAFPQHRDGRILLGMVLLAQSRFGEAEAVFAGLTANNPDEPSSWVNLGLARRGGRRFDAALAAFSRAVALGIGTADVFFNIGLTHVDRLDFEAALGVLERSVRLSPDDAEIRYHYANACFETRRIQDCLGALNGWEALPNLDSLTAAKIGGLLLALGEAQRADAAFARVTGDTAATPSATLILVNALERTNKLTLARTALDVLKANPQSVVLGSDLLQTEAQLYEREGQFDKASDLRREILRGVGDFPLRHFQLFGLARALDAANRSDEAFETLSEAHRSQAAYFALAEPAASLRGPPAMIITKYGTDPHDVAEWDHSSAPSTAESPVFIVAFPRSGTTLLELALDAHPALRCMDEQTFVQAALAELEQMGAQYPERLAAVSDAQLRELRAAYWARVAQKVELGSGQRLVDKNPLNILRLPVIKRLWPNASILIALRHPCDVIFSCFLQHFRAPDFALLCASLQTLTLGYEKTMNFFFEQSHILKPNLSEVRYERLVSNYEFEIRRVCEFLNVPWSEELLSPTLHAQAKGYISTPSYSQVVQPITQKSIGKWRRYERHFSSVMPILAPRLGRWGYDS